MLKIRIYVTEATGMKRLDYYINVEYEEHQIKKYIWQKYWWEE